MLILRGHMGPVRCLAYSPDGRMLASGSDDQTIKLWHLDRGRERHTLTGPQDWVCTVAFAPDGKTLAAGDCNAYLHFWRFRSDGRLLRAGNGKFIAGPRWYTWLCSMAFAPDGLSLVVGAGYGVLARHWMRDLENPRILHENERSVSSPGFSPIYSVVFSPNGRLLATGGQDHTVRLWDATWGRPLFVFGEHEDCVRCVTFSPDGLALASSGDDGVIRLWNVAQGKEKTVFIGHMASVRQIVFSSDGRTLISASEDETVRVWDVTTGCQRAAYNWQIGRVHCLALAPDGMTAAAGGHDHSIVIWDVE